MKIGKVSGNVLRRSVLGRLHTKREEVISGAGEGADCAIFSFAGEEATVTCMQEAVIALGALGSAEAFMTLAQLIQKCVNNLAAGGASPVAMMLTLLLPESVEEPQIKALLTEAEGVCGALGIELMGGQTRITGTVTAPWAVVTGYGKAWKRECPTIQAAAPGQEIVISKWIGLQGTALLAKRNRARLLERYPVWLVEEAVGFDRYLSVLPEAAAAMKSGVCAMHDVSEGGILGALWELAEGAGVGLDIDLRKLPLRQETVEVCECCQVNPYELLSGGCLIMTAQNGQRLADALWAEQIPAVVVGQVTDGKAKILHNQEEVRYLDRPKQDQIYLEKEIEKGGI